jgi:hypothetical protein
LDAVRAILKDGKSGLPESPERDDASGERTADVFLLEDFLGLLPMESNELSRPVLHFESTAVRGHAGLTKKLKLPDPLLALFV